MFKNIFKMAAKKKVVEEEVVAKKSFCSNCEDSGLKCNDCGANGDGGFTTPEVSEVATQEVE